MGENIWRVDAHGRNVLMGQGHGCLVGRDIVRKREISRETGGGEQVLPAEPRGSLWVLLAVRTLGKCGMGQLT